MDPLCTLRPLREMISLPASEDVNISAHYRLAWICPPPAASPVIVLGRSAGDAKWTNWPRLTARQPVRTELIRHGPLCRRWRLLMLRISEIGEVNEDVRTQAYPSRRKQNYTQRRGSQVGYASLINGHTDKRISAWLLTSNSPHGRSWSTDNRRRSGVPAYV